MKVHFTLNGQALELDVNPGRRVVDLLRDDLQLTGTKESCGSGECGACSILVDGESRLSCLMLAAQLEGRRVTTIEGIAADPAHQRLLRALVQRGAVQCGYCSPGMVMAAVDLLQRNPRPQRSAIRTALSGNLCRCTGYQKIIDAIAATAEETQTVLPETTGSKPNPAAEASRLPQKSVPSLPGFPGDPDTAEIVLPGSAEELWECISRGGDYRLLGGGTDLLVWRRENRGEPRRWIGLERVPELKTITREDDEIVIGAAATLQQVAAAPLIRQNLDVLVQAIRVLGSPPIAHMATLGGNLGTASPAADSLPPLYVLQAKVELRSRDHRRLVPLPHFISGPRQTDLRSGEVLWSIRLPVPEPGSRGAFFKVGRRKALAIAVASLAAAWTLQPDGTVRQIRLAWGSVGPTVMVFPEIEQALQGRQWSVEMLKPLADRVAASVKPIDDVRASAAYRRQVAGHLLLKLLEIE